MIHFSLPETVLDKNPQLHPNSFIATGAQVMGDVILKENASVWYNSVLRGDINQIIVGERSNIQDGCILHLENDVPCIVDNDVTVGHHVNLHACHIEEGCLIGIGAIILSGAHIGKGSIIGAGCVVKENAVIPPFSMVVGVPGKIIKETPVDTIEKQKKWAQKYVDLSKIHKAKGFEAEILR
ncbi:gamma carbonic anhydrase family protein [Candidatus Marinamargulisbacteria bacterium SCGC AG-439-L15]|nr:gamma carbonic anhydrase family protein [Candidatus Marinamargulisbacteria bacterium SCGC AG-439-L15]